MDLLQKGVIIPVPESEIVQGYYSLMFLVQKTAGVMASIGSQDSEFLYSIPEIQDGEVAEDLTSYFF